MMNIKKLNFALKNKKKFKFILFLFFIFLPATYFSVPKLLNFSVELIKDNLKNNNNINIKSVSKVEYKIFPTPRLSLLNSNFTIGGDIIDINNSKLDIVLSITKIFNSDKIKYKKILISGGSSKINLDNINQLLAIANKKGSKLIFKKSTLIFFKKNNFSLEISDALMEITKHEKEKKLNLSGNFLNNKIFIKFISTLENKNNLTFNIPKLDVETRVFFTKNNSGNLNGFFNIEVFNNFLKFDFIKENNIKLTNAFVRSKLVNTALEGEIDLKPNFFLKLNFKIANLNLEKLLPLIQKTYFSNNSNSLFFIKKINGIFTFKSKFEGRITNNNGEVIFEKFQVGKNKSYFLSAKIIEFGKRGKIQFNVIKTIEFQKDLSKKIEITGLLIPSVSKIIFEEIILEGKKLSIKQVKEHESRFQNELAQNSLSNIFNENKIEKYLKNLF